MHLLATRVFIVGAALGVAVVGCRTKSSAPKVIGGVEDWVSHPATVGLRLYDANQRSLGICTGGFVRTDMVLTAAHCLKEQSAPVASVTIFNMLDQPPRNTASLTSSNFNVKSDFNPTAKVETRFSTDVAVITFPESLVPPEHVAVVGNAAAVGQSVVLVGYGDTAYKDSNSNVQVKRYAATNTIATVAADYADSFKTVSPAVDQAAGGIGQGDSGGLLYDQQAFAVGIAILNNTNHPELGTGNDKISASNELESYYVNLRNAAVYGFVSAAIAAPVAAAPAAQAPAAVAPAVPPPAAPAVVAVEPKQNFSTQSDASHWCDNGVCFPYCTNGSGNGTMFGWQPELGGPNGGSCRVLMK